MKVAIVYNRESERVINLFGLPNREKYGKESIKRISDALKKGGHQVKSFEGDKDLIDRLEEFMPRVVKGERPGMVFNVSYGIQGQARYTHVPSILEMVGIPYVGSGPEAHSLSLDKVVAKMMFRQQGVPTPEFAVIHGPKIQIPAMEYPLIVKPRSEAVSFGIKVVNNDEELEEAASAIFDAFKQPVLVEQYIEGREINVGLLGNNPPDVFPPAELIFGEGGPAIYTWEDKTRQSGREVRVVCPAEIDPDLALKAQELARHAFAALGCYDCARVDMRVDDKGDLYVLEINSLPSLGEHGSYLQGAAAFGLDFAGLVNRLVEVAATRYFRVPTPPHFEDKNDPKSQIFTFLVDSRDQIEDRLKQWVSRSSRTTDPVGLSDAKKELGVTLEGLGLRPVKEFTDDRVTWVWESKAGLEGGTLIICHVDVPLEPEVPGQSFSLEPEVLRGEGIASSRSPLVMAEYAFRALRRIRRLHKLPVGVLYYTDEGRDCRYSADIIKNAAETASRVLVLRPSVTEGAHLVTRRRGLRTYWLSVQGESLRWDQVNRKPGVVRWAMGKLEELALLSSKEKRISVMPVHIKTHCIPLRVPHELAATLLVTHPDDRIGDETEVNMREILGKGPFRWRLHLTAVRPPMQGLNNKDLVKDMLAVAREWEIPLRTQSSVHPSVAGLVPAKVPTVCGLSPNANELRTEREFINRSDLLQRTLLLSQYLLSKSEK